MTIRDLEKLLSLDPYSFNNAKRGWRSQRLNDQILAITAYILRYVRNNKWNRDTPKAIHEETPIDLRLNLAKLFALKGDYKSAIAQYQQCITKDIIANSKILSTIAFLNSDRDGFDLHADLNDPEMAKFNNNWGKTFSEAIK